MKVAFVTGTRPNHIKLGKLLSSNRISHWDYTVYDTLQHYNASMRKDVFWPSVNFTDWVEGDRIHQWENWLIDCWAENRPDIVIVFGDTYSAVAGAFAANYSKIPLCHIESGVRCGESTVEERNRIYIDILSQLLLSPLPVDGHIHVGDLMYKKMEPKIPGSHIVVTLHRQETHYKVDELLRSLSDSLFRGFDYYEHPRHSHRHAISGINYRKRLDREGMLTEIQYAWKVITDSGGVEREAHWAGVPCHLFRDVSEWNVTPREQMNANPKRLVDSLWRHEVKPVQHELWQGAVENIVREVDKWYSTCGK